MKALIKAIILIVVITIIVFFSYFNNTRLINPVTVRYYEELKQTLTQRGYKDQLLVICTKRNKWINEILVKVGDAAPDSRHLNGEALDFLVFDVNSDGRINSRDVDVVYQILDNEILKNSGGVGTYKKQGLLSKQMVHIDCRGYKARWNR